MTVVIVGNCKINVHTSVLRKSCSDLFQVFTRRGGEDNDASSVLIQIGDKEVVKAYIHWLYSGKIPRPHEPVDKLFVFFAYAYVFGDEIGDPKFKNAVIETMAVYARDNCKFNARGAIEVICGGTQESSLAW
ncbi:hypothetical protein BU24DRAFT_171243 [Aaosphaeria arxii CBS 175.79]|uniref:BTB domain-containing protein n=1 Tax=Aaosphaeria arxii CBS 175.79 TaxID=1450172 RepID=A0A6A5XZV4_9PLEO|nr:uncharacterized protein BU24DRAFT_171243 [Aaosphaeria arxii CBS 175.79]KAF2018453.1 hypothetical protein BU24DRAFT_171243 [Aaosphaeria arxii CBS 175.79]